MEKDTSTVSTSNRMLSGSSLNVNSRSMVWVRQLFDRQLFEYNRVIVIVPLTVMVVLMVMEEQECKNIKSSLIYFTCKCGESIAIYKRSLHNQSFRLHGIRPMPTNHCKKQGENIMIQHTDCRRQKRGVIQ